MNCKSIIFFLVILFKAICSQAQITTSEIKIKEKPIPNSIKYDGISDFKYQKNEINYKQYIGLKVYFPSSYTYNFFKGESEYTVDGPIYFTIEDVIFGDESKKILKDVRMRSQEEKEFGPPLLVLKEEASDKIHYYLIEGNTNDFVLVPYFISQKELYDGKEYVIVSINGKFFDEASEEEINYGKALYGGIWKCEVNMLKESYPDDRRYDGVNRETQNMYYILKDSSGHTITSSARDHFEGKTNGEDYRKAYFVKKFIDNKYYDASIRNGYGTYFMLVDDYNSEIERIGLAKKEETAQLKALTAKQRADREKWFSQLKEKYGTENATLISQGKVKVGMSAELCSIAWNGVFGVISKTTDNSGTYETWRHVIYGTRLYFKDNKLYKIEDKI
jgi:hypothetical protein